MKIIKKAVKLILPYGIVRLYREYKNFKNTPTSDISKKGFDIILSVGIACRPAYHLTKCGLRYCSSPLDWMMSYSLKTIVHLFETKFDDFFGEFVKWRSSSGFQNGHFMDKRNNIVSLHYPYLADDNTRFKEMMQNRFYKIDYILRHSKHIAFISNRGEDISKFEQFLLSMNTLYPVKMTYINIRNNNSLKDISLNEKQVTRKLKIMEYECNDEHPNGTDEKVNRMFWIGNSESWEKILKEFVIKRKNNFLRYLINKYIR